MSTSDAYLTQHQRPVGKDTKLDVLLQLCQDLVRVLSTGKPIHNLELRKLDIYRIVVFAKENLHIVLQDCRSSLDD
jgi:hypothetical protein